MLRKGNTAMYIGRWKIRTILIEESAKGQVHDLKVLKIKNWITLVHNRARWKKVLEECLWMKDN